MWRAVAEAPLERLSEICSELPEAERELAGRHAGFRVRGKTFAWFLDDHHGDGIVAVSIKVAPGRNEELTAGDPERYFMPAYSGPRGWVALRLDTPSVDWDEVAGLVIESYMLIAPKRLGARLMP